MSILAYLMRATCWRLCGWAVVCLRDASHRAVSWRLYH